MTQASMNGALRNALLAALLTALLTAMAACGGGSVPRAGEAGTVEKQAQHPAPTADDKIIAATDFEDGTLEGQGWEVADGASETPGKRPAKPGAAKKGTPEKDAGAKGQPAQNGAAKDGAAKDGAAQSSTGPGGGGEG